MMDGVWNRKQGKPIVWDLMTPKMPEAIVVFCHGYKGFKNWGGFGLMGPYFQTANLALLKFNFSLNGGTPTNPIDFPDLEAFGQNTFSQELEDLQFVVQQIRNGVGVCRDLAKLPIHLIGHSRGGGIVTLMAQSLDVKSLTTWGGVSDFGSRFPSDVSDWEQAGVAYIENARTGQKMPHLFSFYEDFKRNEERLNIEKYARKLQKPWLIIHGTADSSVPFAEAENLKSWAPTAKLLAIDLADHTFGTKEPWPCEQEFPEDFKKALAETIQFIRNN